MVLATSHIQWTEAEEQNLLKVRKQNPLLSMPAFAKVYNQQASQERPIEGIRTKLKRLQKGGTDQPVPRASSKKQRTATLAIERGSNFGCKDRVKDELGDGSSVSTVPSDDEDQIDELDSDHSRSPTPPSAHPRPTSSHPPATPLPFVHPNASHSPAKSTSSRAHAKPAQAEASEDSIVTEMRAIETKREQVKALAELAEMERAFLRRHGRLG